MPPPPAKPFAVVFLASLGLFIVWGIVGSILEPRITDPTLHEKIGHVVMPIAFGLFLVMGFSAVPVMVRIFFKLFFGMQKAIGDPNQPIVRQLQENQDKIAAVFVYAVWAIYALGTLIGAPFFFKDMMAP